MRTQAGGMDFTFNRPGSQQQEPSSIRENFSRIVQGFTPSGGSSDPPTGGSGNSNPPVYQRVTSAPLEAARLVDKKPKLLFSRMFPWVFTYSCFIIYLVPLWLVMHLAYERNVLYWFGPTCQLCAFLPLIFICTHIAHVKTGALVKRWIWASFLVPSAVLFLFANFVSATAISRSEELVSTDCNTFPGKVELENAWLAAQELFESCLDETVKAQPKGSQMTKDLLKQHYRIQDCQEYATKYAAEYPLEWSYLRDVEENEGCAGWCTLSSPLWAYTDVTDSCSVAVAHALDRKVSVTCGRVVIYCFAIFAASCILFLRIGPFLRRRGIEW